MIIGGEIDQLVWTDDIEIVSLDGSPIPDCLTNLNPFPYGTITESVGAAMAPGML